MNGLVIANHQLGAENERLRDELAEGRTTVAELREGVRQLERSI